MGACLGRSRVSGWVVTDGRQQDVRLEMFGEKDGELSEDLGGCWKNLAFFSGWNGKP